MIEAEFEPVVEEYFEESAGASDESYEIDDVHIFDSDSDTSESEVVEIEENTTDIEQFEDENGLSDTGYQDSDEKPIDEIPESVDSGGNVFYVSQNYVYDFGTVTIDREQYESLVNAVREASVSADWVTRTQFEDFMVVNLTSLALIGGVLFGYFAKESIFRGV